MTLPWMVLAFLLFFVGMFVLVYFSMRNQDKALEQIMQQQKVLRMEFERLADALDELLEKHEVEDRDFDQVSKPVADKPATPARAAQPAPSLGVERLLLGPEKTMPAFPANAFPSAPGSSPASGSSSGGHSRSGGMPDLKF